MPVYNSAKSQNPAYWITLSIGNAGLSSGLSENGEKEGSEGLTIIADLTEEVSLSFSSNWVPRMNANLPEYIGLGGATRAIGINTLAQVATQQVWESTTPIEFPFTLLFDAYDNAKKNVFDPINSLITYGLPSGEGILSAPGPSFVNYNTTELAIKLRVGRMLYISDGIMVGCQPKYDSRLAEDGYPIAGQVDITIRTSVVYSRTDWIKATGQGPALDSSPSQAAIITPSPRNLRLPLRRRLR